MTSRFMRFPGGRIKALTLSYDDNVEADVRLAALMKKHGLKGTFNINSGQFPPEDSVGSMGCGHRRLTVKQSTELHKDSGIEIACHGVNHPFLEQLPEGLRVQEILEDRRNLERIYGGIVRGMAYPFGTYSDDVIAALKACGIVYARTIVSTEKFELPTDWLQWHGTCHHGNPKLMKLAQRFVDDKRRWTPQVFYLWGHSYEFDDNNNWNIIEEFAEFMGGREEIWYATNIEIYDYVTAWKQLIFNVDGTVVYNPTNTELFIQTERGNFSILPGETKNI